MTRKAFINQNINGSNSDFLINLKEKELSDKEIKIKVSQRFGCTVNKISKKPYGFYVNCDDGELLVFVDNNDGVSFKLKGA